MSSPSSGVPSGRRRRVGVGWCCSPGRVGSASRRWWRRPPMPPRGRARGWCGAGAGRARGHRPTGPGCRCSGRCWPTPASGGGWPPPAGRWPGSCPSCRGRATGRGRASGRGRTRGWGPGTSWTRRRGSGCWMSSPPCCWPPPGSGSWWWSSRTCSGRMPRRSSCSTSSPAGCRPPGRSCSAPGATSTRRQATPAARCWPASSPGAPWCPLGRSTRSGSAGRLPASSATSPTRHWSPASGGGREATRSSSSR
jgi:hypothetical protein